MKSVLWQSGRSSVDRTIMEFLAGEDVVLDRELFPFDIQATEAHIGGLRRIGILDHEEEQNLRAGLRDLNSLFESGEFELDDRFEDGHSAIEMFLTDRLGALGGKVHTGRSRNDQVAVATRLYLKAALDRLALEIGEIARACLKQAQNHAMLPMPGYTHMQRAVPSSVGLWLGGFAEAFTDDLAFLHGIRKVIDSNPLGTAAGYGVNLPLDREGVSEELGFARLQVSPMYTQNSRGKFEVMVLQAAMHAMQDVRRLAWDLSLFTTSEFDFVRLPGQYSTGSSIMPNKANPDVVELLRARAATPEAAIIEIQSILSLPSGYQRDLQLTKAPLIRGLSASVQALAIVPALVEGLSFNEDKMAAAISPEMYATDLALEKATQGVPFRDAYLQAKAELDAIERPDAASSLAGRVSPGGCGDLQLDQIGARLEAELKAQFGA